MAQGPSRQNAEHSGHRYVAQVNPAYVTVYESNGEKGANRVGRPANDLAEPESDVPIGMKNF